MGAERLTGFAFHRHTPRYLTGTAPASSVGHSLSRFVSALEEEETADFSPSPFRRVANRTKTIPSLVGSGGFGVGFSTTTTTRKRVTVGAGGFGTGFPSAPVLQITRSVGGGFGIGGAAGPNLRTFANLSQGGFGVGGGAGPFARTVVFPALGFGVGYPTTLIPTRTRTATPGSGGIGIGFTSIVPTRGRTTNGSGGFGVGFGDVTVIRKKVVVVGSYDGGLPISSQAGSKAGFGVGGGAAGIQLTGGGSTEGSGTRQKTNRGAFTQREVLEAVRREAIATTGFNERLIYIATDPAEINKNPPGETFIVLTLFGGAADQPELTGGGRTSDITIDQLEFRIYSRLSTDQQARQTDWTLSIRRGCSERARVLRDALHMIDVMDDSGYLVLAEPMRTLGVGQPGRDRGNDKAGVNWGYLPVRFEVKYTVLLSAE